MMIKRLISVMIKSAFLMCLFANKLDSKQYIPKSSNEKKYNLSICAIFKNEAKCLKEWIEYHLLVGVDHFYLYNMNSTDEYLKVLKPYLIKGMVTLIQWQNFSGNQRNNPAFLMLSTRIPAYENAAKYVALHETEWLVFVDVDEFLVPPYESKLTDILEKYKEYPGVVLMSDYFDSTLKNIYSNKRLIIESILLSSPPEKILETTVVKTIFKPEFTEGFTWPPYTFSFKNQQSPAIVTKNEIRINQYMNRNVPYYFKGNVKRNSILDYRVLSDYERKILLDNYEVDDQERAIHRFIPEVRKKMGLSLSLD